MDPNAVLKDLVNEILDNDEDGAVESAAILWGWAAKGGFPPEFRAVIAKVLRERIGN
jgi:hypothetical protein